jgi:hypothetical protein
MNHQELFEHSMNKLEKLKRDIAQDRIEFEKMEVERKRLERATHMQVARWHKRGIYSDADLFEDYPTKEAALILELSQNL